MHELNLKLLPAGATELTVISSLAREIWEKHYTAIIGANQIKYMLDKMYDKQSLLDQFLAKKHVFYLVNNNDLNVGFISVNREKDDDWLLNKFYILGERASNELGTEAFQVLKQLLQPNKITLTVNRQNYKSINFYFKNGFKIDHVADFDIGEGFVMNDFVMEWRRELWRFSDEWCNDEWWGFTDLWRVITQL